MKLISAFLMITALVVGAFAQECSELCEGTTCPMGMSCSLLFPRCTCDQVNDFQWQGDFELTATVRDFSESNPDFGTNEPLPIDVGPRLGEDGKPVFLNNDRFNDLFNDVSGVNQRFEITIELEWHNDGTQPWYSLGSRQFFPIDGSGFGNEGYPHNFLFTTEVSSWTVDYLGGEFMDLLFDDGVLIYLNGWLVYNHTGLSYNSTVELEVDELAANAGMVPGNSYLLKIFHMERLEWHSMFYIETNMLIHPETCPNTCSQDTDCINGLCDQIKRVCNCQDGWAGDYCNQRLCWNVECGENGYCDPNDGHCYCNDGWAGRTCGIRTCNYHGDADQVGTCLCDDHYEGEGCHLCRLHNNDNKVYICKFKNNRWYKKSVSASEAAELISEEDYELPGTDSLDCNCLTDYKDWDPCREQRTWYNWCEEDDDGGAEEEEDDDERMLDMRQFRHRQRQLRQTTTTSSLRPVAYSDPEAVSDTLYLLRRARVLQGDVLSSSSIVLPNLLTVIVLLMVLV